MLAPWDTSVTIPAHNLFTAAEQPADKNPACAGWNADSLLTPLLKHIDAQPMDRPRGA